MPKLSIITVNLNNAEGLQKTIESVVSQTFTDYEYIIIDGGSTDESTEIIKKYANKITYWVSEPDKGIYNGMNKGIKVAKGEYCLFLNSGDWLIDNEILNKVFKIEKNEDVIFGNLLLDNYDCICYSKKIKFISVLKNSLPHQASFIKKNLFEKYGLYNENFEVVSDWEFFMIVFFKYNCSYRHINSYISVIEAEGVSSKNYNHNWKEKEISIKNNFPVFKDLIFYLLDIENELKNYKSSRLIRFVKKIQNSKLYKTFISK